MNRAKKNRLIDMAVFVGMLLAVSAVTLLLFYRQCMGNPQRYHSDMRAYILEMQGLDSGYSFPYPIFFKLSAFLHLFVSPELAVAIATMVLNSGAMVVTKLALNQMLLGCGAGADKAGADAGSNGSDVKLWECEGGWVYGAFISVAAISLFFISMLYTPEGIYLPGVKFRYLGVFTPNPFHNATYMAARPFAILAFLWFVKLLPVYEQGLAGRSMRHSENLAGASGAAGHGFVPGNVTLWDYIWFSVFLLLATLTKPSFTLVMVSTAGLVMLYRMIRSRFQNFVPTLWLGLCFIPTFIDLLYQFKGVFASTEKAEGGLGFCFGDVWALYNGCIPVAVCLAVGFPLLVLLLNARRYRKSTLYLFSWQLFAVSLLEAFLLFEKGFRKPDFNFSWGYMYGIFFCHFGALLLLLQVTIEALRRRDKAAKPAWLAIQWLAYLCHVLCGMLYFKDIFAGGMYY